MPFVADFLIITLPTSSSIVSNPKLLPKFFINCITRSSFLEGRGTAFKSANLSQSCFGSNALISELIYVDFISANLQNTFLSLLTL